MHVIAGKAVAFGPKPDYATYIEHVVENARRLGEGMIDEACACVGRHRQPSVPRDLTPADDAAMPRSCSKASG